MAHSNGVNSFAVCQGAAMICVLLVALLSGAAPTWAAVHLGRIAPYRIDAAVATLPSVRFSAASYSQNETGGAATITVQLSDASSQTVAVHYATRSGSAFVPGDYAATSGELTFNPGQTNKSFSVPIRDDQINEPDETVGLVLSAPSGATLGVPASATLTIFDNEELTAPSTLIYFPVIRR